MNEDLTIKGIINSIESKLDETSKGLIADDFANLMVFDNNNTKVIEDKDNKISQLNSDKDKLLMVNGNLLQKVSMGTDEKENDEPDTPKPFNFRSLFDDKGNMKR